MDSIKKKILIVGLSFGLTAVLLGAFAAHGLKQYITDVSLQTFETGVRYQMYHALFLLLIGIAPFLSIGAKKRILLLVICGLFLFSGSIYMLATNAITSFDFKIIGFITPIGGGLLIIAWLYVLLQVIKTKGK